MLLVCRVAYLSNPVSYCMCGSNSRVRCTVFHLTRSLHREAHIMHGVSDKNDRGVLVVLQRPVPIRGRRL